MTEKYKRTYHIPFSPGATSDDKIMSDVSALYSCADGVITEKMDGECTTIHRGGMHARSVDGRHHPSRDWVKAFAAGVSPYLAENERVVGENMFARHSISYSNLETYFYGFALIVDGVFQSWDDTIARFGELGVTPVPVLYRGPINEKVFRDLVSGLDLDTQEGAVARTAEAFLESQMPTHMAKWVREGHVQTDKHWMHQEIVRNGLKV